MRIGTNLASRRLAGAYLLLALTTATVLASHALAYDGVTFGVQIASPAGGAVPLTANVVVPVATLHDNDGAPVGVAVRGDLSYAAGSGLGPSAGVNLLLSDASHARAVLQAYLGAGVAVASVAGADPAAAASPATGWAPTVYGVVGWCVPLGALFAVRVEGLFNATLRSAAVQLGLDFSPWGKR